MRHTFIAGTSFAILANAQAGFDRRADVNATISTSANATIADPPKTSSTADTYPTKSSSSASSSKPSTSAGDGTFEIPKTSQNSYLTVINPLKGTVHNCGEALKVTWSAVNAGYDKFFDETISIYLIDASNYKDAKVVNGGTFPGDFVIKNLKAEVTIPKVPSGKTYAIKVSYKDTTKYVDWYSAVLEIRCSDGVASVSDVKASSSSTAAAVVTAAVSTDKPADIAKSASRSVSAVTFTSLIFAFLL
ncbi:hypothetical protein HDU81_001908 [Chytriomyces hyalinus]|nr:hypothetical protein HDU81_001908 [Chytriomyces hyalinus]